VAPQLATIPVVDGGGTTARACATLRVLATTGVMGFALVILLAVLPGSRRAYT
jgi:preprotein translocase subunit SecD